MVKGKDKLFTIFKQYMVRKKEEEDKPVSFNKRILFYEWSDVNNTPITFYGMDSFVKFMDACGIIVRGWQKGLISSMPEPHVACEKGSTNLIFRGSKEGLRAAIEVAERINNEPPSNVTLPVLVNNFPPVYGHGGYEYNMIGKGYCT